jgi:serine/threonine protein kinase
MKGLIKARDSVRFEDFQLDLRMGELRRNNGKTVRLPEQPFRILTMLLDRPGDVVTRDEIRKKLWPNDTVVEFEHSISAAMNRLRQALGDSAENPRFIETLARRGYRLLVSVERLDRKADGHSAESHGQERSAEGNSVTEPGSDSANLIGKRVSHYRVLQVLGGGGMGVVYKAEDIKLGRQVAMKFLPEEVGNDKTALERFEREARAASALDHPNICPVYEFGEHGTQPFIVMPLLEGVTLRERIAGTRSTTPAPPPASNREGLPTRRSETVGTALPLNELVDIAIQIANGLEAAHQKSVIHRDIKPANIFISTLGRAPQVKILDFGLAKLMPSLENPAAHSLKPENRDAAPTELTSPTPQDAPTAPGPSVNPNLTRTGTTIGTAAYMSPEQIRRETLDHRTDLFSLGLVLYEMAAGKQAFAGNTAADVHQAILHHEPMMLRELNPQLPSKLQVIVDKALEKDRDARYQTASELRGHLDRLRQDMRPQSKAATWHWPLRAAAMLAMLIVGAAVAWFAWQSTRALPELKQEQLTDNSNESPVESGAISPDGRYLAYSDVHGMHIKLIEVGETQDIPQPESLKGGRVSWQVVAWFPSGTMFLANASPWLPQVPLMKLSHPSTWKISVMGGVPRKLCDEAYAWSISPDGASIAFTTNFGFIGSFVPGGQQSFRFDRDVWVMNSDGTQRRKVFETDANSNLSYIHWSPDGHRLAYQRSAQSAKKWEDFIESRDLKGSAPVIVAAQVG